MKIIWLWKDPAKVDKYRKEPYTKITFIPDYKRLGIPGISDDMIALNEKKSLWCSSMDSRLCYGLSKWWSYWNVHLLMTT